MSGIVCLWVECVCVYMCVCVYVCVADETLHFRLERSCYSGFSPLKSHPDSVIMIADPLSQYLLTH